MKARRPVRGDEDDRWIEAVHWHAQRCGETPLTAQQRVAWRRWCGDAENRRVYAACATLHAVAQQLGPEHRLGARSGRSASAVSSRAVRQRLGWLAIGVALAIAVGGVMLRIGAASGPRSAPARIGTLAQSRAQSIYRTTQGQTRRILLHDGSTVILGAQTTLTVLLTPTRRAVRLRHGEAWFHVAHRRHWPFVVTAGDGTITDVGTAFVVDQESGRTQVTVTQGMVRVAWASAARGVRPSVSSGRPVRLHRGERLSYGAGTYHVVQAVNPRRALAWARGQLEFSNVPLRYVVQDVSRYSLRPIRVSPAAGYLRVTTLVLSRDIPAWLTGLSRVLPVTITRGDGGVCIRLRVSSATSRSNVCTVR